MNNETGPFYWRGKSIVIRTERAQDAEAKWAECFDSEARRLLQYETELPPISFEAYSKFFTDCEKIDLTGNRISLHVDNLEGEFVGWVNINGIDYRNGTFSPGVGIFRPYQRRGYGTEVVQIVLRYCFNELRLHKCSVDCLDINLGSQKLLQRLHFEPEGRVRECLYFDGAYHDKLLYGLTADEFNRWDVDER